ncbi:MAG: nucleotidyltransferase domain-containing protein [archaeon]
MLKKLFTSGSRVEILKELLFNPQGDFYLSDLARTTGTAPIQTSKELENLESLNLVERKKVGKLTFYSINKNAPIYEDIKNIFLKTDSLGNFLRTRLKNYEITHALIFGSFAAGEERKDSDVDLLIVGDINENALVKTVRECEKSLKREINYILWNRKEFEKRAREGHHLLRDIKEKSMIMLAGDENEFREAIK